jgi:hypothetical protein
VVGRLIVPTTAAYFKLRTYMRPNTYGREFESVAEAGNRVVPSIEVFGPCPKVLRVVCSAPPRRVARGHAFGVPAAEKNRLLKGVDQRIDSCTFSLLSMRF